MEEHLLRGSFTTGIIACFTHPRPQEFDYNLLEPLIKMLRLSSDIAYSLARSDMFDGILHKLYHKKAVARLNLLRVLDVICEAVPPSEEGSSSLRNHELFEAIRVLADQDEAVLVRQIAMSLLRVDSGKKVDDGVGRGLDSTHRTRNTRNVVAASSAGKEFRDSRRQSFTPPSLTTSLSTPITPTHGGRLSLAATSSSALNSAFLEGNVTPRRTGVSIVPREPLGSGLHRPKSRDGVSRLAQLGMTRRTSAETIGSGTSSLGPCGLSKSRLPRTSMLRSSRSSISTMSSSNSLNGSTLNGKSSTEDIRAPVPAPMTPVRQERERNVALDRRLNHDRDVPTGSRIRSHARGKSMGVAAGLADANSRLDMISGSGTAPSHGGRKRHRQTSADMQWS